MKLLDIQDSILKRISSKEFIASVYGRANFKVTRNPVVDQSKIDFSPSLVLERDPQEKKNKKKEAKKLIFVISDISEFPYVYSDKIYREKTKEKVLVSYVFKYGGKFYRIPSEVMKSEFNDEKEFFDTARPLFDSVALRKFRDEQLEKLKKKKPKSKVKHKLGKLKSMIKREN